jgi:hypothetical protein
VLEDHVTEADRLASWARQDVASAEAAADLLSPEEVAAYYNSIDFRTWMAARWAVSYASNRDFGSLLNHLNTQTDEGWEGLRGWIDAIPTYGQAFDSAASSDPQAMATALRSLTADRFNYFFIDRPGTAAHLGAYR